jgi:hypothetical protein
MLALLVALVASGAALAAPKPSPVWVRKAKVQLAHLKVRVAASMRGYDRD